MANTKQRAAVAEHRTPSPAGCAPHERADWLPNLDLAWFQVLRSRHVELAYGWADAVDAIGAARDEHADREAAYRAQVRSAVAIGDPPPVRSADLDPALREAHVGVALEDARRARDLLAEHVLDCLAELRAHRVDLYPHLGSFSASLLGALAHGSSNQKAIIGERLRRQIAEFESDGPAIEIFDESSTTATPELKGAHA